MFGLHFKEIEADGAGFRALGPDAMPDRLLGIFGHEPLEFGLGILVLQKGRAGLARRRPANSAQELDELMSTTRTASMRARGGSSQEQARRLAALNAAPELFLGCEQEVLVERISRDGDLDPFAAARDDREHRGRGVRHPHVVLKLRQCIFAAAASSENDHGSMNLDSKTAPVPSTIPSSVAAINRTTGWFTRRWTVLDRLPGISLVPVPIEVLGHDPELDDEVAREVVWLDLTALLPPEAERGRPRRCP